MESARCNENCDVLQWQYQNKCMPTIKITSFTTLEPSLEQQLGKVFETGQLFAESYISNTFPNQLRTVYVGNASIAI